jgi:NTE family protein
MDPVAARILASEGGRSLLALDDEEMTRFLSSSEGTVATTEAAQSSVGEQIKAARSSLETRVDLVFEGAGFRQLALVGALSVLEDNGFVVSRAAGASGGALVAALHAAGYSATELWSLFIELDTDVFADGDWKTRLPLVARSTGLLLGGGPYVGQRLHQWIGEHLAQRGVRTFRDLGFPDDREDQPYRLQLLVSDLTDDRVLALPRDAHRLGVDPDDLEVALAVRMSISLPLFFEPVRWANPETGTEHLLIDGTVLSDFPVGMFDAPGVPQWPTFGLRLIDGAGVRPPQKRSKTLAPVDYLERIVRAQERRQPALLSARDSARTISIDTLGVDPTELDIPTERRVALYESGRRAAEDFLGHWSFEEYRKLGAHS